VNPLRPQSREKIGIGFRIRGSGKMIAARAPGAARAGRIGARAAILLGDDELAKNAAAVRDLDSGAQELVPLAELTARLKTMVGRAVWNARPNLASTRPWAARASCRTRLPPPG